MSASALPAGAEPAPASSRTLAVTVGRLKALQGREDELVTAAAAAIPLGSTDAADRAVMQLAAALGDLRHWQQRDVVKASPETKYGAATVAHGERGDAYRVLRGELEAVLLAANLDPAIARDARNAAAGFTREGFRSLAVARARLDSDGTPGEWGLLGIIPLKARLADARVNEHPADWVYIPLWDKALRLMHWTAVACILLLIGTGYMIATPFLAPGTAAPPTLLDGVHPADSLYRRLDSDRYGRGAHCRSVHQPISLCALAVALADPEQGGVQRLYRRAARLSLLAPAPQPDLDRAEPAASHYLHGDLWAGAFHGLHRYGALRAL
jgi:hypothetical protein